MSLINIFKNPFECYTRQFIRTGFENLVGKNNFSFEPIACAKRVHTFKYLLCIQTFLFPFGFLVKSFGSAIRHKLCGAPATSNSIDQSEVLGILVKI